MTKDTPDGASEMPMIAEVDFSKPDFTRLDDSTLLARRAEMRAELEQLPAASPAYAALTLLYDISTQEVNARATRAWTRQEKATQ